MRHTHRTITPNRGTARLRAAVRRPLLMGLIAGVSLMALGAAPAAAQGDFAVDVTDPNVQVDWSVLDDGGLGPRMAAPMPAATTAAPVAGESGYRTPGPKPPVSTLYIQPSGNIALPPQTKTMIAEPKPEPHMTPAPEPVQAAEAPPPPAPAPEPMDIPEPPAETLAQPEPVSTPAPVEAAEAPAAPQPAPAPQPEVQPAPQEEVAKAEPEPAATPAPPPPAPAVAAPEPTAPAPVESAAAPEPQPAAEQAAAPAPSDMPPPPPQALSSTETAPPPPAELSAEAQPVPAPTAPAPQAPSNKVTVDLPPKIEAPGQPGVAALPPATDGVSEQDGVRIVFEADSSKLPTDARDALATLAKRLEGDDTLRLQLLAYAGDADTSASAARRLSLSRALAVRSYLIENGVRSTRIDVRALGNKSTDAVTERVDVNVMER